MSFLAVMRLSCAGFSVLMLISSVPLFVAALSIWQHAHWSLGLVFSILTVLLILLALYLLVLAFRSTW